MHTVRNQVSVFLAALATVVLGTLAGSAEPQMRLRLKDGSFTSGTIVPTAEPGRLGWQADGFVSPFAFELPAVRSVTNVGSVTETAKKLQSGEQQLLELSDGGLVAGKIQSIEADWIAIKSQLLGNVKIHRRHVLAIVDAAYAGEVVYSGPINDQRWTPLGDEDDWEFEGGALVAKRQGAAIVGEVDIPPVSQIHVVLSWRGTPDFVLSLGTLATNKVSRPEEVPSAARIEVWDRQLALVREVEGGADIAMLSGLSNTNPRVELTIYLNQETGIVTVCDSHGRPLDTLDVPSTRPIMRTSVHLANIGPSLSIEKFEVRKWDGITKSVAPGGNDIVLKSNGEAMNAVIIGFDAASNGFILRAADGTETMVPVADVRRGVLVAPTDVAEFGAHASPTQAAADRAVRKRPPPVVQPPALGKDSADDQTATGDGELQGVASSLVASATGLEPHKKTQDIEESQPTSALVEVEVILTDRSRLSGRWLPSDDGELIIKTIQLLDTARFDPSAVLGVIGTSDRHAYDLTEYKNGTIKIGESELTGYLEPNSAGQENESLSWHPHGSSLPAFISRDAVGAIVYRKPLPKVAEKAKQIAPQQAAPPAMLRLFLGGATPVTRNELRQANAVDAREMLFRTGDAINSVVERIDEQGVHFKSDQTSTTFAKHDQIQHVWLNRTRGSTEVSPKKLERLMTVPRSMKNDPPTHLFVSITGDYLRGRLVRLEKGVLTVEVRLELTEIPAEQVSQIIWLHDRNWGEEKDKADGDEAALVTEVEQPFRIHAIRSNDRGLTFRPSALSENRLIGFSELLGDCSVAVSDLNQLLFGVDIAESVRAFREDPWTLSLAQYPKVFLDAEGALDPEAGKMSELVGQLAPDFGLETADGQAFRLSTNRDRIVVLDFWASWCGPCMQTMPAVEAAVEEFGSDKVHLVAVNIQETADRAQAAIARLEINPTVLMDNDGQVAAAYQANAIPQTVIIDRDGRVTHLFVGGGARFVTQFNAALASLATPDAVAPAEQLE